MRCRMLPQQKDCLALKTTGKENGTEGRIRKSEGKGDESD